MPDIDKRLLRLASAIHACLVAQIPRQRLELPTCSWDRCAELVRQSRRAEMRGWKLAAEERRLELGYAIPTLQSELNALASRLPRTGSIKTTARVGDIYADLLVLKNEFNQVDYDARGRWLSVTTEPITLEAFISEHSRFAWIGIGLGAIALTG